MANIKFTLNDFIDKDSIEKKFDYDKHDLIFGKNPNIIINGTDYGQFNDCNATFHETYYSYKFRQTKYDGTVYVTNSIEGNTNNTDVKIKTEDAIYTLDDIFYLEAHELNMETLRAIVDNRDIKGNIPYYKLSFKEKGNEPVELIVTPTHHFVWGTKIIEFVCHVYYTGEMSTETMERFYMSSRGTGWCQDIIYSDGTQEFLKRLYDQNCSIHVHEMLELEEFTLEQVDENELTNKLDRKATAEEEKLRNEGKLAN